MTTIGNLFGFTIISKEIIKPSSPTPSHLKTYNLTIQDQIISPIYMPVVIFYPNTGIYHSSSHDKTLDLKKSLSQTLTKYYPFAGRLDKVAPASVDCNDNGVEFIEASIDTTLSDFLQNSQHQDLDQFFPHGTYNESDNDDDKVIPLLIQVSHFECGGVAVAVSMFHKIADASSLLQFIYDWAIMTRGNQKQEVPIIDPEFISFEYNNINSMGVSLDRSNDYVTKTFMFTNSKINDLKLKVKAMIEEAGQPITNLTRVEVLNWLVYKCAVAVTTKKNSGSFKPTSFFYPTNLRRKMKPLSEKCVGNYVLTMEVFTKNESEMKPESFISELRKHKMQLQGLRNIETAYGFLSNVDLDELQRKFENGYTISSMCGSPAYEIDFGWGKPIKITLPGLKVKNLFVLIDAPNRSGIEASVCLEKQDMDIFQSEPELLAFI